MFFQYVNQDYLVNCAILHVLLVPLVKIAEVYVGTNCSVENCDPVYGCLQTIANKIETAYQGTVFPEIICLKRHILYLSTSIKQHQMCHIFFLYMSLFLIIGLIHNSNDQSENELSIFGTSTTNKSEDHSMFNTPYRLHGLNGVLCLFLFAFKFHICK